MAGEELHLRLQTSEAVVAQGATRIFAAYLTSGIVNERNEEEMILRAVRTSMKLAYKSEQLVLSDDEAAS